VRFDDVSKVFTIKAETINEDVSIGLCKSIFNKLSTFYVDKKTEKESNTFARLSEKADSVNQEIISVEKSLARFKDYSYDVIRASDRVTRSRLERELQLLIIMYGEVLKNKETAGFVLSEATPFLQVIDAPIGPLPSTEKYSIKTLAFFLATGAIVSSALILLFSLYKQIMD